MKKIAYLLIFAAFFAFPAVAAETESPVETPPGNVVLALEEGDEPRQASFGEQVESIMTIGSYFDEAYPGNEINADLSEDVQRFFPDLRGNDLYDREQTIRDGVKFYRFFSNLYDQVMASFLVPEDPPLVLDEQQYEMPDQLPYIDSPDTVVITDFKTVVSYSSQPRDGWAYLEKFHRERLFDNERSEPLRQLGDLFSRLGAEEFFLYGRQSEDPLSGGGGNGAWTKGGSDETAARLITAETTLNDQKEIKAAVHLSVPEGKFVKLVGGGKPFLDFQSDNLESWAVFLPVPKREGPAGEGGRGGDFALPVLLKVKNPAASLDLRAQVAVDVCDEQGCQTETLTPELFLPSGFGYESTAGNFITQSFLALPEAENPDVEILSLAAAQGADGQNELHLQLRTAKNPAALDVFIDDEYDIGFSEPRMSVQGDDVDVFLTAKRQDADLAGRLFTVIVSWADNRAVKKTLEAAEIPLLEKTGVRIGGGILLFAVLGGFLLNFMPCVFPVLALKLMSLAAFGAEKREKVQRSFAYTLVGIWIAFAFLILVLLAVKSAGAALGWGIQFQSPYFLVFMLFAMVLFLAQICGIYEIRVPAFMQKYFVGKNEDSLKYLLAGGLVVLMSTSCTAPYLATAVGFALCGGAVELVLVMAAVAFGLSLPYLLFWQMPGVAVLMPKPGKWMKKLELFMAFLMLLTIIWLLSLIGVQVSGRALAGLIGAFVLFWLLLLFRKAVAERLALLKMERQVKQGVKKLIFRSIAGVNLFLLLGMMFWIGAQFSRHAATVRAEAPAPIDYAGIERLVAQGQVVLVRVGAEWCLTCKFNDYTVFKSPFIAAMMQHDDIKVIDVDWTDYNPDVLAFMSRYGRAGIPFYVIFSPKFPYGMVLPEVLTEKDFRQILLQAGAA